MDKIRDMVDKIKSLDQGLMDKARKRQDSLTKPRGSLGRLEELSIKVVGITGKLNYKINNKVIVTMAGDHGVAEEGVSLFPQEVTPQMVLNFIRGGAGINVLSRHIGARVIVVDMGVAEDVEVPAASRLQQGNKFLKKKVGRGTRNMTKGPAMKRDEAIGSIEAGAEIFEEEYLEGIDIIGTGDMGIGNTTASSAIIAAITGRAVGEITGRGTGIDDGMIRKKIVVIEKALEINQPDSSDPIDVLSKVGGYEIGGLAGWIIAGAANRVPIVIDGFISTAAALIATKLAPKVADYLIAAHTSAEKGHRVTLEFMGLRPLLEFDMRLGEGTGAALGISIVEAAVKVLNEMATFNEAKVSGPR